MRVPTWNCFTHRGISFVIIQEVSGMSDLKIQFNVQP